MTDSGKKLLSVVVPVYFEEEVLPEFYSRAKAMLSGIESKFRYELLFVNDGSTDRSLPILRELVAKDSHVRVLNLSRNFGHQLAITSGIEHALGDAVVVMDGDLQDPPEVVPEMMKKWEEGFHVVYGMRKRRKGESAFKLLTAKIFYRLIGKLSDVELPVDSGDFRLMDRKVVDAFNQIREENRYIRGLIAWLGFNQCALEYERDARYAGETKYTLKKMMRFAIDGVTSFSEKPLKFATQMGFGVMLLALVAIAYLILQKLTHPSTMIQGWTSVMVSVLFMGGVQLLSVGILGEYVGRIYREVKDRPLYLISDKLGFGPVEVRSSALTRSAELPSSYE